MKKLLISLAGMVVVTTAWAQTDLTFDVNQAIPDGNPAGLTLATNLTGLSGDIADVTVSLDITGGYNGDLYAYLAGPNGGFAVLLNRVGIGSDDSIGYGDSGFDITLDDGAADNIHYYQEDDYSLNDNGQLTGTWQPDGENVDPLGNSVGLAPATATLSSLDGTDPNGTWTLFLADLSNGGQSTVATWSLDITTVPEPSTMALTGLILAAAFFMRKNRVD